MPLRLTQYLAADGVQTLPELRRHLSAARHCYGDKLMRVTPCNGSVYKGTLSAATREFLCANHGVFVDTVCLELGAGTGVVGLALGKLGARRVILTDYPNEEPSNLDPSAELIEGKILSLLEENVQKNGLSSTCEVRALDWQSEASISSVLDDLEVLDYLVASDVFYDVCTFRPLMTTICKFFDRFPKLRFYFSYAERDDNWSIEDLLLVNNLQGRLIESRKLDDNTVQICILYRQMGEAIFCGVEGGASQSKLVFVDAAGRQIATSSTAGTNYNLEGIEKAASKIAKWVQEAAKSKNIRLPLKGLGMGLSGAEGARDNALFIEYLRAHHSDLAEHVFLTSDSVATVATAFENGGVILIAGTGSSCRVLLENGRVFGVGGWGHILGDGGSAFWIALRAIRMLFDEDDGMEIPQHSTQTIRRLMLQHFKIEDKVDILEHLYNKFQKSYIASFTKTLAECIDDLAIEKLFFDAGEILGRQFLVAAGHIPSEYRAEINLVLVGSVFLSWDVIKKGFVHAVQGSWIPIINIYRPSESSAIGAAAIVARQAGFKIPHPNCATHVETLHFY